ncbi:MAG: hypothetical protein AAGA10_14005 [Bacteroidota bacterium]
MKHLLFFAITFFFSDSELKGQENLILKWFEGVERNFEYIVDFEKKKRISRGFGYLASDLDQIMSIKDQIQNNWMLYCAGDTLQKDKIFENVESLNTKIGKVKNRIISIRGNFIFTDEAGLKISERKEYHPQHPDHPYNRPILSEVIIIKNRKEKRKEQRNRKKYDPYTKIYPILITDYKVEGALEEMITSLTYKSINLQEFVTYINDCNMVSIEEDFRVSKDILKTFRDICISLSES